MSRLSDTLPALLRLALLFLTEFMNFLSTDFFTLNGSSVGQPLVSPVQPRVLRPSTEPDPWEVLSTQQILRWTKEWWVIWFWACQVENQETIPDLK